MPAKCAVGTAVTILTAIMSFSGVAAEDIDAEEAVRRMEADENTVTFTTERMTLVIKDGEIVRVRMKDRQWTFPLDDCVLLPVSNTTAKLIASWLAGRVEAELRSEGGVAPKRIRVEVEESPGQSATYEVCQEN